MVRLAWVKELSHYRYGLALGRWRQSRTGHERHVNGRRNEQDIRWHANEHRRLSPGSDFCHGSLPADFERETRPLEKLRRAQSKLQRDHGRATRNRSAIL